MGTKFMRTLAQNAYPTDHAMTHAQHSLSVIPTSPCLMARYSNHVSVRVCAHEVISH